MWGPGGGKHQSTQGKREVWSFNGLVRSFFFGLTPWLRSRGGRMQSGSSPLPHRHANEQLSAAWLPGLLSKHVSLLLRFHFHIRKKQKMDFRRLSDSRRFLSHVQRVHVQLFNNPPLLPPPKAGGDAGTNEWVN